MADANSATAITIGNFDGVHLGHLSLISTARHAVGHGGRVVVLAFDPHPLMTLRPDSAPPRLTSWEERVRLLQEAGADEVHRLNPTREFLNQAAADFIANLAAQFSPGYIVEGSDFQFGRGRGGSIATLRELESAHHYQTIVIEPVDAALSDQSLVRVSSSMIRWLLGHGRVRDAALLLGRPYELISKVVSGDKRGREIGMPTVNLAPNECLLPADGIYAGYAIVANHHSDAGRRGNGEISYPAAISVGTKPTFGEHPRVCEAHLIGYDGPLDDYGWTLRLQFTDWIRDQLKYERVDLLIDQLKRDIERVRQATSRAESNHRRGVQSASENTQTSSTGLSATLR